MNLAQNPILGYVSRPPRPERELRPTGRPKKRTPAHYAEILRGHEELRRWFYEGAGRMPTSDRELYEAFRDHVLSAAEPGTELAQEVRLGMSIKTVRNVLAEARRHFRDCPENSHSRV